MLGVRGYAGSPTDEQSLLGRQDARRRAVEREELGLAVWQPLRVRDEDLVALTVGSPRVAGVAAESHAKPQGRIPTLMTAKAQPCGDTARHPNLARRHCRTADPLARWVR